MISRFSSQSSGGDADCVRAELKGGERPEPLFITGRIFLSNLTSVTGVRLPITMTFELNRGLEIGGPKEAIEYRTTERCLPVRIYLLKSFK